MKLERISIKNYRSILETETFNLSNYTVLIGKNNEGKSNILNAINIAFQVLRNNRISEGLAYRKIYDFETDYPMDLQNKKIEYIESHPTCIGLVFSFNENEQKKFHSETGLTYSVPIEIKLNFEFSKVSMNVSRRREDEKQSKTRAIGEFITDNFGIIYIPAIRTAEQSIKIIDQIVSNGLSSLIKDEEYRKAYELIWKREQEKLNEIAANLKPTLQLFVPSVKDITLDRGPLTMRTLRREIDFFIDDGNVTSIDYKGDGIKSLVQIALLKETSGADAGLIMIEEPESHLHSGAIHELHKVLLDISNNQQIIITTHNPIFINTTRIQDNHIVGNRRCYPSAKINEIRTILGIHFSDSLFASDCVVVVEGESDKKVFSHLLSLASPAFKKHLDAGTISFMITKGAPKAPSYISFMGQMLIRYFAIWDNDSEGLQTLEKCKSASIIGTNYRLIPLLTKNSAVLEDLLDSRLTTGYINSQFHCNIGINTGKLKWSDYILRKLTEQGFEMSASELEPYKMAIAENVLNHHSIDEIINVAPYKQFIIELANSILSYFQLEGN